MHQVKGGINMGKLFGTDGVRGVANKVLTAELAYRLGRAGAYVLSDKGKKKPLIVIGRDTRISGYMLEGALSAGINSVGGDVIRIGVLPTPAVAFITRSINASAGIVISASHNPVEDNGIKFFSSTGYKLPDPVEIEIEEIYFDANNNLPFPIGKELGKITDFEHAIKKYVDFAKSTIDSDLKGFKVVIDCANGAAYQTTPRALEELGAEVIVINSQPDGTNINEGCGSTHPQCLQDAVLKYGANVGIAHDGDADRMLAVDEKGNLVNGDQIMVACSLYLKNKGLLKNNSMVVTVMSNLGLFKAMEDAGINVYQTKVGDRYVLEKMIETDSIIGGEQSGHIIFAKHNTTGDGLISALQLLQVMVETGKPLSELASQMEMFPQVLVNARVINKEKVMNDPNFARKIKKAEADLKGDGRILVRPSGTEPLIRVMVEGSNEEVINKIAGELADVAEEIDKA
jgi:phosphoglucosamine mutase